MPNVNSVLYNVNQDFPETSATGASKARARANIGAASAAALDAETARAQAAEGAARTEIVQGDGIRVERTQGASGQSVYIISNNGQGVFKRIQNPVNQSFNAHACITGFTQDAQGVGQVAVEYMEDATQVASGLMSATDKTKLDGIASGAEVNQDAFSNVKVGSTTIQADSKTDTLELAAGSNVTLTPDTSNDKIVIAATDTTYSAGTGLTLSGTEFSVTNPFTTADKNKLDGIAAGAEVNQDAFSNVKVGSTTIQADSKTDTLELAAGSNVTLTPDATNDKIVIAATDTTYSAGTGLTLSGTQFSVTNPFTTTDKNKLDGIASGAEVNQNTFANVKVGSTTIQADSKTDTLEIAAGSNITLTPDATNDKIVIAATDTTYSAGTGLTLSGTEFSVTNPFTSTDKNKLDGIAAGAEVNQNSFANVKVGSTTIAADSKTDTLELIAGSNVTLTPDAANDNVTVSVPSIPWSSVTGRPSTFAYASWQGTPASAHFTEVTDWSRAATVNVTVSHSGLYLVSTYLGLHNASNTLPSGSVLLRVVPQTDNDFLLPYSSPTLESGQRAISNVDGNYCFWWYTQFYARVYAGTSGKTCQFIWQFKTARTLTESFVFPSNISAYPENALPEKLMFFALDTGFAESCCVRMQLVED